MFEPFPPIPFLNIQLSTIPSNTQNLVRIFRFAPLQRRFNLFQKRGRHYPRLEHHQLWIQPVQVLKPEAPTETQTVAPDAGQSGRILNRVHLDWGIHERWWHFSRHQLSGWSPHEDIQDIGVKSAVWSRSPSMLWYDAVEGWMKMIGSNRGSPRNVAQSNLSFDYVPHPYKIATAPLGVEVALTLIFWENWRGSGW